MTSKTRLHLQQKTRQGMEEIDGVSLAIGGTACTAIGGLIGKLIQARFGRTEIATQPLMVQRQPDLVDKPDCEVRMSKIEKRIEHLETVTDKKLGEIHEKVNACATGVSSIQGFIEALKMKGPR
jgi:hypothetical protein